MFTEEGINGILNQIRSIKKIMIDVAVGNAPILSLEEEYIMSYIELSEGFSRLKSSGVNISNPNSFTSIFEWQRYWKHNFPHYQERREYIDTMYSDLTNIFKTVLYKIQKGELTGETSISAEIKSRFHNSSLQVINSERIYATIGIQDSLTNFKLDYPDSIRTAFVIMSFAHTNPHDSIVKAIKSVCSKHSIIALRADDKQYHDDLYQNILTYIYGCDFGIAIYERILQEEFNPNVAFEVGYMMGLRKPILMLKDKTLNALNTDLAGKMYKDFDPFDLEKTVTISLEKWLSDKEFIAM